MNPQPTPKEVALSLLILYPPSLRTAVIEDHAFRQKFDLHLAATVSFEVGIAFDRGALFQAIRIALAHARDCDLAAKDGKHWKLEASADGRFVVKNDECQFALPDLTCLSSDREKRVDWFKAQCEQFRLVDERVAKWLSILGAREIEDEEVDELLSEIRLSPAFVAISLLESTRRSTVDVRTLVPDELGYYERLVGKSESERFTSYFETSVKELVRSNLRLNAFEGMKSALLMSSHSVVPKQIDQADLASESVSQVFEWLMTSGDRVSQLGAVEWGLNHLDRYPELEAPITKLVGYFLKDDPEDRSGRLRLLSSLIVLVEGELARIGVMRSKEPFWRRLASISHASMIERAIIASKIDASAFGDWAFKHGGRFFYAQTFVDMRREPRWLPEFVLPDQLAAEFIGRVYAAAQSNDAKIKSPELRNLLFGSQASIKILFEGYFLHAFLPGPLEGGIESRAYMPPDIEAKARSAMAADKLSLNSFAILVNTALIFRLGTEFAQLAAEALRRAKYQIRNVQNSDEAFGLVVGLATVAAVTRTPELSGEIRILLRGLRRRPGGQISRQSAWRIGMVAAAATEDPHEWCRFVGDWITELAFEDMKREEAAELLEWIDALCRVDPQLWETCSRAEAALRALWGSSAA